VFAINFGDIHKLAFEIYWLRKLITHRHADRQIRPSTWSAAAFLHGWRLRATRELKSYHVELSNI